MPWTGKLPGAFGWEPSAPVSSKRPPHEGSYFPAAGYRNNGDGAVNNVGSNGNWWSSCPNSTDNSHNLNFNSSNLNPLNNNNRANGFSVRPARIRQRRMQGMRRLCRFQD